MNEALEARRDSQAGAAGRVVLRNTLFLTIAQVACLPLSMLASAITARYLGPAGLGYIYLGTTFNAFGFLAVDWGQSGSLPALVATDRARATTLLGSSLVWRAATAVIVYGILALVCRLLGYGSEVQAVVALVWVGYTCSTMVNACQQLTIGFERTDLAAYRQVVEQVVTLLIVAPIMILGGGVNATLGGHALGGAFVLAYMWRSIRSMRLGRLSFDKEALLELLRRGTPFVFLGLAMVLQPGIDAVFLSRLSSAEVVGWHAAARRLIGVLILPTTALAGALYPTLCRLFAEDEDAFKETVKGALRATNLLVIPVALGCFLYPDIGISIYSRKSFAHAEDNLRVLSVFLFLLYFTMPLGTAILARGEQRSWTIVQSLCVGVSVVLDPILVPWFQQRTGNGGLGICVAAVVSELVVLACGVALAPRGIFDREFWRSLLLAMVAGAAMILTARLLRSVNSFVAASIASAVYAGALWSTGAVDPSYVAAIRARINRKLSRFKASRDPR